MVNSKKTPKPIDALDFVYFFLFEIVATEFGGNQLAEFSLKSFQRNFQVEKKRNFHVQVHFKLLLGKRDRAPLLVVWRR
jgi:hypothetical protein